MPDSRTMSCIEVRWKPCRAKQAAAASRICLRRAAKWASSTLGTGIHHFGGYLGDRYAVERGGRLVAAQRSKIPLGRLARGDVFARAQPPLGQVARHLRRV